MDQLFGLFTGAARLPLAIIDALALRAAPPKTWSAHYLCWYVLCAVGVLAGVAFVMGAYIQGAYCLRASACDYSALAAGEFTKLAEWFGAFLEERVVRIALVVAAPTYLLLRVRQLGRDINAGRIPWPEQVAAAHGRRFFGVVFGNSGTGKSTLLDHLYHRYLQARFVILSNTRVDELGGEEMVRNFYEQKISVGGALTPYRVTGASKALRVGVARDVVDVPGQAWRCRWTSEKGSKKSTMSSWSPLVEKLLKADDGFVLNVMSFGYAAAIRRRPIYEHWEDRCDEYLKYMRREEERALDYVVEEIEKNVRGGRARGLTFVNVVNMAAFWWPDCGRAKEYYESLSAWSRLSPLLGQGRLFPFVPLSLLFDDQTLEFRDDGSDGPLEGRIAGLGCMPKSPTGCRTPIFCAHWDKKKELAGITNDNILLIERLLYGFGGSAPNHGPEALEGTGA